MEVRPHRTLEQLQQIERGEKNAGRAKRLRIIILAIEGWTAPSIAMAVGMSRRAVQDWVARYNADGMQGLEDGRGKGTRPPLDDL